MKNLAVRFTRGFSTVKALAVAAFVALASLLVAPAAMATGPAAPSATAIVDYIESLFVPVAAIGAAVLLLLLGIKAYKWMRRAT